MRLTEKSPLGFGVLGLCLAEHSHLKFFGNQLHVAAISFGANNPNRQLENFL